MSDIKSLHIANIIKDLFDFSRINESTAYLNGVKALAIIFITIHHSYDSRIVMPFKSGENLQAFTSNLFYQVMGLSASIMDFFFVIGGILTAMSLKNGLGNL